MLAWMVDTVSESSTTAFPLPRPMVAGSAVNGRTSPPGRTSCSPNPSFAGGGLVSGSPVPADRAAAGRVTGGFTAVWRAFLRAFRAINSSRIRTSKKEQKHNANQPNKKPCRTKLGLYLVEKPSDSALYRVSLVGEAIISVTSATGSGVTVGSGV